MTVALATAAPQLDPPKPAVPPVPVPMELRQRIATPTQQAMEEQVAAAAALPNDDVLVARTVRPLTTELIGQLASPRYAERRAASERLQSAEVPLDDLLTTLAKGGLTPEQHHRVLSIAFDRIVNAPRGALGIQMNPARPGDGGVRVTRIIPGFPAEKFLEVDDMIVAIDGRAVRDVTDLRMIVQGQPPGTEVRVEAIRAERDARGKPKVDAAGAAITRRIDVRVPLGSKRELDNAEPTNAAFEINPLDTARQEQGRAILRRFAPQQRSVRLPDDAKLEADFASRDIEQHEYVNRLRIEVIDAKNQQRGVPAHTVGWFRAQIRTLRVMAADPAISDAERQWHGRVADRLEAMLASAEVVPSGQE